MHYYGADGRVLGSRYDALRDGGSCHFYFHDREYEQVDWTRAPSASLAELYRARAEQIRRDYDYIVLAYSGGADSTNMLETFLENDIPVDEVLTVGSFSRDSFTGSDENRNGDFYHSAFPVLRELKGPRVTIFDYAKALAAPGELRAIEEHGSDWCKHASPFIVSPHHLVWASIDKFIGCPNKKCALVFGGDKPWFGWDGSRGYVEIQDSHMSGYGNRRRVGDFDRVYFYTDPAATDILRKQAHVIQQFFLESGLTYQQFHGRYADFVHALIYRLRRPVPYVSQKSTLGIISSRDRWVLQAKDSDIYRLYVDGLREFMNGLPDRGEQMRKKIVVFKTRRYYLS